jgi:signal peptidase I
VNRAAYFHVDWQKQVRYLFGGPQRRDVVVFDSPVEPGTDYIKRLMGLPGERVAVSNGTVYVNGTAQTEPYIKGAG